jgi:hypothetical protein
VAVYDQDPDLFAANYFGMTVPEYRKWVLGKAMSVEEQIENLRAWAAKEGLKFASKQESDDFFDSIT